MTTGIQDREFLGEMIGTDALDRAIDWIASNLSPDDVFTTRTLEEWAENNDYEKKEQS